MTESIVEERKCSNCGTDFSITDRDLDYYRKVDVPAPVDCPDCREQRRCMHVNQINLFKRRCDATGKSILSNYPPNSPCKVFAQNHWASDAFDAANYGRDYDFSRPFFEQYHELSLNVPRPSLVSDYIRNENSDYVNYAGKVKNCYLIFDSDENQDCYYSYGMNGSRSAMDCYRVQDLELCYETIDSSKCYNCALVYNSENCRDSILLNNCIGCQNCIMCSNLRHKQYYILNKEVSKEEFETTRKRFGSYSYLQEKLAEFEQFKVQFPQKYMRGFHNENVSGNHLVHCKNAHHCYDSMNIWDGKYCYQVFINAKDSMDIHEGGFGELMYECIDVGFNSYNLRFCTNSIDQVTNLTYCDLCQVGSSDLFGCIGLRHKTHHVLNKAYSKDEYEKLVPRIINNMKEAGEWGRFFPPELSHFPYNLTVAQEIFPLTKEEALQQGYTWQDPEKREYQPATAEMQDKISDVPESVTKELFSCQACGKNYKIIPQEITFYKNYQLPLPRKCFHCRHLDRFLYRNPRHLWTRKCDQCGLEIESTYAPARPEKVYCEDCYQQALN